MDSLDYLYKRCLHKRFPLYLQTVYLISIKYDGPRTSERVGGGMQCCRRRHRRFIGCPASRRRWRRLEKRSDRSPQFNSRSMSHSHKGFADSGLGQTATLHRSVFQSTGCFHMSCVLYPWLTSCMQLRIALPDVEEVKLRTEEVGN